jgi:ornithine carbamoyltransferase
VSEARNFITGKELKPGELLRLIERGADLKPSRLGGPEALRRRSVAILLEKPSTRTRVSF